MWLVLFWEGTERVVTDHVTYKEAKEHASQMFDAFGGDRKISIAKIEASIEMVPIIYTFDGDGEIVTREPI